MRFLLRRFSFYLVAAFVAVTLNFFIPRLMVGDPVQVMFAQFQGRMDPRALESLKETFGFVQGPILEQYVTYLSNLARGNLGLSVSFFPVPVNEVIAPSLVWTLRLIGLATITSFGIGIVLGIYAAWRRGGVIDSLLLPIASAVGAFPFFWIAMLVLYIFGLVLKWFPIGHAYDVALKVDWGNPEFVNSVIRHAFLPMVTVVFTAIGGWLLGMRNNMIGVLSQDYVTMAQAKGLSDWRVMITYAARNAILPSVTAFSMSLGFVVGGALVVELVFAYPGMGFTLLKAVQGRDYPLMQGVFLLITLAVLAANFLADVFYVILDPRAR
ncbi:MAG: ABC transporter permease [Chloroflexi bacterium]|nr:ABC transporter permease [Chloroflexota bacterium]GIL12219.1 MAG: peptide ABC transporter permease [Chloroflexota bacterium]